MSDGWLDAPWVWPGVLLVLAATALAGRRPGARPWLMVGWTWLWAEALTAWWLPSPGEPIDHDHPMHRVAETIWLEGDVARPPDPAQDPLIVLVGDSFTRGQGAPAQASVPARVRQALAPEGVSVRDLGVRGTEFPDQLTRWALLDRELSPDVLVWGFVLNDLEVDYRRHDAISVRFGLAAQGPTPLTAALRRMLAARSEGADVTAQYREAFEPDGRRWVSFERDFRRLVAAETARDARFILLIWPLMHELDAYPFRDIHTRLAALGRDAGAEVVDLLPVFEGRDERALWAHPLDHHPNAVAYGMAADALLAHIRSRPIPSSRPWGCDDPTLLPPPRDALERTWCEERTPDTLRANAIALKQLHEAAILRGEPGAMIGRIPLILAAAAAARRDAGDPERARDIALHGAWVP